ncbi:MAG: OsmC family protein [Flavobacteriales bacterium]|nr:OsmC family protein [Flavobacteriales bacterium]MCW8913119.1 OsmC family protein [Flavobacteriales bacterium]MCW8937799.1 OsmC family protein [Flavobacteriales bacterium]MCW8967389.1 OsmC family protein [Flavobacteriales bacterium]MCW8989301.1 OsmC family protein [Flavobacteriales bacterium]
MSNLNFLIVGTSISATKYEGKTRHFKHVIDEPETLGGKDEAANPVEYILAGYAGCLNVVYNLIAKEIGIEIYELNISINGDINPEKFLGLSNKNRAGFQSLNVHIELETNGTHEQEQQLIAKAKDRCPVNDNLANPTPIKYLITQPLSRN